MLSGAFHSVGKAFSRTARFHFTRRQNGEKEEKSGYTKQTK